MKGNNVSTVAGKPAAPKNAMAQIVKLRERDYLAALNLLVDQIYEQVSAMGWSYPEFAERAAVSTATVYRIGSRLCKLPRFQTVWKMGRAVGGTVEFRMVKLGRARKKA